MTLEVKERSTAIYTATIQDAATPAVAIASADIDTLTLTLYDKTSGDIINSRDKQDILNANNVTVHATSGLLTWTMQALDNVIVDDTQKYEKHIALFEWTWSGGSGKHETTIEVENFAMVTSSADTGGTDKTAKDTIPLPDITGDVLVDTLQSLRYERLRVARAGPMVSYTVDSQNVNWSQYLDYLDRRIERLRTEIVQETPWETVSVIL